MQNFKSIWHDLDLSLMLDWWFPPIQILSLGMVYILFTNATERLSWFVTDIFMTYEIWWRSWWNMMKSSFVFFVSRMHTRSWDFRGQILRGPSIHIAGWLLWLLWQASQRFLGNWLDQCRLQPVVRWVLERRRGTGFGHQWWPLISQRSVVDKLGDQNLQLLFRTDFQYAHVSSYISYIYVRDGLTTMTTKQIGIGYRDTRDTRDTPVLRVLQWGTSGTNGLMIVDCRTAARHPTHKRVTSWISI